MSQVYKIIYNSSLILLLILNITTIDAQDEFFEPKTTIGGYGELHFNQIKPESSESKKTLDFHRFVVFLAHSFSEKWSFKSEIELEHNIVEGEQGALELEQAYIDYHFSNYLGFQAGVILPSVGIMNEIHEPPTFFGVERPEYNKYIIPTTWFGNGLAIYGKFNGLDYKFTIMEGLNSDNFSASSGIRESRQEGFKSNANDLLYNIRINYLKIQNLLLGVSFSYNNAKGDSTNIPINLIEGHLQYVKNNLIIVGEYGLINYKQGKLEKSSGFYLDTGYNVNNFIGANWDIIPFFRYSQYNTAALIRNNSIHEKDKYNISKWMIGLSIKPIPQVAVKFDYAVKTTKSDNEKTKLFNFGIGYMF